MTHIWTPGYVLKYEWGKEDTSFKIIMCKICLERNFLDHSSTFKVCTVSYRLGSEHL